jgi:signal transduction histidine kinase
MSREISSFLSRVSTILGSISSGDLEDAHKSVKSLASGLPDDKEAGSLVQHLENLINRLCEKTRQDQEQIRELFLTRDKFFSIISHDLRSPFNAILGFSDILSEEWDELTDSDKKTFLLNIKSTSHNTFDLLERLLQWSRVQTGKMKFTPGRLDICQLIRDTFHLLAEPAGLKCHKIHLERGAGYSKRPSRRPIPHDHNG